MRRAVWILWLLAACASESEAPGGTWEASGFDPAAPGDCACDPRPGPLLPGAAPTCYVESEWSAGSQSFAWREVCEADDGRLTVTTRWGTSNAVGEPDAFTGGCHVARVDFGGVAEDIGTARYCTLVWRRTD